jgi:hypothetical protein
MVSRNFSATQGFIEGVLRMKFKNHKSSSIKLFALALVLMGGLAQIPIASAYLAPAKADAVLTLPNHAPEDFIQVRPDIPKGKLETITYNSKSIVKPSSIPLPITIPIRNTPCFT